VVTRPCAGVALVTALAVGLATPALAQTGRDPREVEAKKTCLAGRWERGIELLADLYAETGEPTYIYNQGRCFQQNGRSADAVTRFREYLRKAPSLSADEKAQVEKFIRELESPTDPSRPSSAGSSAAVPVTPPPVVPVSSTAGPVHVAVGATAVDDDKRRRTLRVAGIAAGAVGLLSVAGGVVMGLRVKSLEDDVTKAASEGRYDQSKYNDGRRAETLEWVGLGVGVAALASGAVLYFLGVREVRF
jgi:hypothetical protein